MALFFFCGAGLRPQPHFPSQAIFFRRIRTHAYPVAAPAVISRTTSGPDSVSGSSGGALEESGTVTSGVTEARGAGAAGGTSILITVDAGETMGGGGGGSQRQETV